jgi:hypothetical protein
MDQLMMPLADGMPLDYARRIVEYQAAPEVQARIDELADKCSEGELTQAEREEYAAAADAIHLIGFLQHQARRILANGVQT